MDLKNLKYLSDKRISDLKKLGITSCEDLIKNFPRSYVDLRKTMDLNDAYHNDFALTIAKVETEARVMTARNLKYVKIYCSQSTNTFTIIWFNQPYVAGKLKVGKEYVFYGRVQNKMGLITLTNPVFEEVDKNYKLKGIVPVYSIKGNITQSVMRLVIKNAITALNVETLIPESLVKKYSLMPLKSAYYEVHNPKSERSLSIAEERIALEEYFKLITAFKIIKGDKKSVRTAKYNCSAKDILEFSSRFGFDFTDGQKRAVNEIFKDLNSPFTMNRLLQGDVGSGKTAVALTAIYMALKSKKQVAFIAPTEVLAKQNFNLVRKYLSEYNAVFLSGSVKAKEKKELKEKLKNNKCDIVVGTHALLEDDVIFSNLSLCVCDEQQRFGVAQRSAILDKGSNVDMLVISATPIPRTLSLIFYGDLDISVIKDKPQSRTKILTKIVPEIKYMDMLSFICKEIDKGRQVYFVCPKIDGDEEGSIISVKEVYEELSVYFSNYNVGLLHGKLKDNEKLQVMQDFKDHNLDILISTTVIEVGVDVPNATIMVILSAERFGLSQLHQLRGRVGRSNLESYCFLMSNKENEKSIERLNAIKNCDDGFKISEIDYDMRGGGDFLGERQSGKFLTELGNLKYSTKTIFFAKALSEEAFNDESNVKFLQKCANETYDKLKNVTLN